MRFILVVFLVLSYSFGTMAQSSNALRLVSWNVFLRPGILNDGQLERIDSIAKYLENTDADVLVLQEVFHRSSRKKLSTLLHKKYPNRTKVGRTSFFGVSSGVLIFSKHEIVEEKHVSFKHATGSDRLAKKGGVSVLIKFKNKLTQIIGTHLQAGGGNKRINIRKNQIKKLKTLSNTSDSVITSIYAGDFNIDQKSEAYLDLLQTLKCKNDLPKGEIKSTANFSDQELMEAKGRAKWIDFILLRNKRKAHYKKSIIQSPRCRIRNKLVRLSDHNPIHSSIIIE